MAKNKRREIGEGDRESARRYNKHAREFVESAKRKGKNLRPDDWDDDDQFSIDELADAEREALDRAKEQDPQVSRNYKRPTVSRDR